MIILRQKLLLWFTAGYNQVSVLLPLLAALPNYFSKAFKLGGLIQTIQAFRQIQDSMSFIVNSYTRIAEWQAVSKRLLSFLNHIYDAEVSAEKSNKFVFHKSTSNQIEARNLYIETPKKEKLLEHINLEFIHGKNYLLTGVSGLGKSTFIRAIAGIWPYGGGDIYLPDKQSNIMYIPQKSYMPIGTLKAALLFPDHTRSISDDVLERLLEACGLPHLVSKLHYVSAWSGQLSPGELQRVAFVRILLHKPDWVFLDESTSALDLAYEKQLYELLRKELPNCSMITVGHRPSLEPFHEIKIDMQQFKAETITA